MSTWALSGGIKVERAKEHIRDLEAAIAAFIDLEPYGIDFNNDEDGWKCVGCVNHSIVQSHLPRLGAIAGDSIHNLRSALDVLWRNVMGEERRPTSGRPTGFQIYQTAKAFEASRKRKVARARKAAFDVYATIKPYKGGNDVLWCLHELDITQKHHTLLMVLGAVTESRVRVTPDLMERMRKGIAYVRLERFHPIKHGEVVARGFVPMPPKTFEEMRDSTEFVGVIALHEPGIVENEPLLHLLKQFAGMVDGVVESFRLAGCLR